MIVARTKTPCTESEVRAALAQHFSGNSLALAMAQTALETRQWQSLYNYNLGNITVPDSYSGDAYRPVWWDAPSDADSARTIELRAQKERGDPLPVAFASYDTLQAGAAGYAERLRRQFPEILAAFATGQPSEVASAINQKYCKNCFGDAEIRNLSSLAVKYGLSPELAKPKTHWFLVTALALGAWGLWRYLERSEYDKPQKPAKQLRRG